MPSRANKCIRLYVIPIESRNLRIIICLRNFEVSVEGILVYNTSLMLLIINMEKHTERKTKMRPTIEETGKQYQRVERNSLC